jgi:hypothetical protein
LTLFLTPLAPLSWLVQSNTTKSAALPPPTLSFATFAGPKYRKPKVASHNLRARSFGDGCLCSILHGPLQLQIWTAFLLPARSAVRAIWACACALTCERPPGQLGYLSSREEGILSYCNPPATHTVRVRVPPDPGVSPLRSDACGLPFPSLCPCLAVWRRLLRHGYED